MGYRVALMPVEVGTDYSSARAAYMRWPSASVASTVESESFLSRLVGRWPSIAERPSRFSSAIVVDDEAPFQVDIDGGLIVLEVAWDSLTQVMPDVRGLAAAAGVSMYLPFEGAVVRRDQADVGPEFEHVGRFVRPDEPLDMTKEWAAREVAATREIDQIVEDAHVGLRTHSDRPAIDEDLSATVPHTMFLWLEPCHDLRAAIDRAQLISEDQDIQPTDSKLKETLDALRLLTETIGGKPAPGLTIEGRGGAIVVRVPADLVEAYCPEVVGVGIRFGMQVLDETAGALF